MCVCVRVCVKQMSHIWHGITNFECGWHWHHIFITHFRTTSRTHSFQLEETCIFCDIRQALLPCGKCWCLILYIIHWVCHTVHYNMGQVLVILCIIVCFFSVANEITLMAQHRLPVICGFRAIHQVITSNMLIISCFNLTVTQLCKKYQKIDDYCVKRITSLVGSTVLYPHRNHQVCWWWWKSKQVLYIPLQHSND